MTFKPYHFRIVLLAAMLAAAVGLLAEHIETTKIHGVNFYPWLTTPAEQGV